MLVGNVRKLITISAEEEEYKELLKNVSEDDLSFSVSYMIRRGGNEDTKRLEKCLEEMKKRKKNRKMIV